MAEGISARLSPAEGRRFGFSVGAAFLGLTALIWWRGGSTLALWMTASTGALLILGGAVIPARLGPIYRAWMGFAQLLSCITTPIFLGIVYFVAITPIGLAARLFRRSTVGRRRPRELGSFWVSREEGRRSDMSHQF